MAIRRGLFTLLAVLLIPWLLWVGLITGGWALLLIVPAVALYWVLTLEFYSKKGDGVFRFARTKDSGLRARENEADRARVFDVPSAVHDRAAKPIQTARQFHGKHRHPIGAGRTFEP